VPAGGVYEPLRGLLNFTGTNARSARTYAPAGAIDYRADRLQIQVPAPLCDVVGVTDAVAELRSTSAYIANFCHKNNNLQEFDSKRAGRSR